MLKLGVKDPVMLSVSAAKLKVSEEKKLSSSTFSEITHRLAHIGRNISKTFATRNSRLKFHDKNALTDLDPMW